MLYQVLQDFFYNRGDFQSSEVVSSTNVHETNFSSAGIVDPPSIIVPDSIEDVIWEEEGFLDDASNS